MARFKTRAERLDYVIQFLEDHKELQQFGQPLSTCKLTKGGKAACLVCNAQILILLWTGKKVTLDQVCRAGGYPSGAAQRAGKAGMLSTQFLRALAHYGVHYKQVRGWEWSRLERKSMDYGPIVFFAGYGWHPEWKGYHYAGRTADEKPNGYARPHGQAGKNQLFGFSGSHAEFLAGYRHIKDDSGKVTGVEDIIRDVNHGSASRPEKPAYDIMRHIQSKRLYEAWRDVPHTVGDTYAFIPTRVFNGRP